MPHKEPEMPQKILLHLFQSAVKLQRLLVASSVALEILANRSAS
jgi:hypothetical protein